MTSLHINIRNLDHARACAAAVNEHTYTRPVNISMSAAAAPFESLKVAVDEAKDHTQTAAAESRKAQLTPTPAKAHRRVYSNSEGVINKWYIRPEDIEVRRSRLT